MTDEPKLRYPWRKTWPDSDKQRFHAMDGELMFAQIRLGWMGSEVGIWCWSVSNLCGCLVKGRASTAREAAAQAEAAYLEALPRATGLLMSVENEIAHFVERGLPLPPRVLWRKRAFIDKVDPGPPTSERCRENVNDDDQQFKTPD